jgi:hypothetical protein
MRLVLNEGLGQAINYIKALLQSAGIRDKRIFAASIEIRSIDGGFGRRPEAKLAPAILGPSRKGTGRKEGQLSKSRGGFGWMWESELGVRRWKCLSDHS